MKAPFFRRLAALRRAKRLTERGAAALMRIPKSTWTSWENGTRTPPNWVQARVLEDLRTLENNKTP